MNYEEYHKAEGIRSSVLAQVWTSPAHAKMAMEDSSTDSKALVLGGHIDTRVFKPQEYKALNFKDCAESMVPGSIGTKQAKICDQTFNSLKADKDCQTLIFGPGESQTCYFWEETTRRGFKVKCKLQLDRYIPELKALVDLKSTADANFDAYTKSVFKFKYDIRLAHYAAGLRANGKEVESICIVAVETKPPYLVNIFEFSEATMQRGMFTRNYCLDILAECMETETYPGYRKAIRVVDAPVWVSRMEA